VNEVDRIVSELEDPAGRVPFRDLPEKKNVYYAVWVDASGADDLSAVSPEPIREGIVYVGECVEQSARRHLSHSQIGSLTLMKNLAALFRESWRLRTTRKGERLEEPGLRSLRNWMAAHLTATVATRHPDVRTADVLATLDPCLRLAGWRPERTVLRKHLTEQRAELSHAP
jgi:hypothetical protein